MRTTEAWEAGSTLAIVCLAALSHYNSLQGILRAMKIWNPRNESRRVGRGNSTERPFCPLLHTNVGPHLSGQTPRWPSIPAGACETTKAMHAPATATLERALPRKAAGAKRGLCPEGEPIPHNGPRSTTPGEVVDGVVAPLRGDTVPRPAPCVHRMHVMQSKALDCGHRRGTRQLWAVPAGTSGCRDTYPPLPATHIQRCARTAPQAARGGPWVPPPDAPPSAYP